MKRVYLFCISKDLRLLKHKGGFFIILGHLSGDYVRKIMYEKNEGEGRKLERE